jgi:8-oxo-dGTP diphosphatase
MNKLPMVWVGVIVKKDWKILMGKRKWSHWAWYRWFPWGSLKYWEEFFDCAKREVKEEADVSIWSLEVCWITNDYFIEDDTHFVTIFVSAQIVSWEIKNLEPHKLEYRKRIDTVNLPENLFLPIKNLLKQWYTL